MKYTADSWFFIQLSKRSEQAAKIWHEIKTGKGRLVVPTIVLVEVKKRLLSFGLNKFADELIDEMEASHKISIIDLTIDIAKEAGRFGNTYNCTTPDAVILATAIETGYTSLITNDEHFIPPEKQGKIKIINWT